MNILTLVLTLLTLGGRLTDAQCNSIYLGYSSPNPSCAVDPNDGSNLGVYARVDQPCAPNEVLYLSLSYTAPGGSITRTETSAQLGTTSPFVTTFTFDIPQTYFVNGAIITQTFQVDNSAPTAVTTTLVYATTNSFVPRYSESVTFTEVTVPTSTYVLTYSDTLYTSGPTVTSTCTGGIPIVKTATATSTNTVTYTPDASTIYTTSTSTVTQTVRCTQAGGGIPPNFVPSAGVYETDFCYARNYFPLQTYYYTGPFIKTTYTRTNTYAPYTVKFVTSTFTPQLLTSTVCNKPTSTSTSTYTKYRTTYVTPVTTRATVTSPYYTYNRITVAPSVC